ncbi:hypothetical protein ACHHYP_11738 [Achlya hypogyna]|uniref:FYVE-type domain-containing protein n=1 Tax=Achlya hypogyna TaxID=1202772 RepID=A0A1V9YIF1_ACHHY|nr:hypothetical protein ACHHYP_11738 [Achlya hypogyna]
MSFPLPSDYFDCPRLEPVEKEYLINLALKSCHDTVRNAIQLQSAPIEAVLTSDKTKRHARIRRGTDIINKSLAVSCAYTQIQSTIEEVADFFYLDSLPKLRAYARTVGQVVLDRQTLYTLVPRDVHAENSRLHYIGVDWMAIECPFLVANRDACFLECHEEFEFLEPGTHALRRGFVRSMHSVDLDCCPPLKDSHNVVRLSFVRSGHVFIETDEPGLLNYYSVYGTQPNGKTVKSVAFAVQHKQCARIARLEEHLQYQRMVQALGNIAKLPKKPQSKAEATFCGRCDKKFQLFSAKKHCEMCGVIVCSGCCQKYDVVLQLTPASYTVCTYCFTNGQEVKPLPTSPMRCGVIADFQRCSRSSRRSSSTSSTCTKISLTTSAAANQVYDDKEFVLMDLTKDIENLRFNLSPPPPRREKAASLQFYMDVDLKQPPARAHRSTTYSSLLE